MTPDQAVRVYNLVLSKSKPYMDTISLEAHTFKDLLPGIRPDKVLIEKGTNQPKIAIVKKSTFCEYFKSRYGITESNAIRRDSDGESES